MPRRLFNGPERGLRFSTRRIVGGALAVGAIAGSLGLATRAVLRQVEHSRARAELKGMAPQVEKALRAQGLGAYGRIANLEIAEAAAKRLITPDQYRALLWRARREGYPEGTGMLESLYPVVHRSRNGPYQFDRSWFSRVTPAGERYLSSIEREAPGNDTLKVLLPTLHRLRFKGHRASDVENYRRAIEAARADTLRKAAVRATPPNIRKRQNR
ncbi:MAG: hypothetical protein V1787_00185 [Candidatus Micrarchaeota archaeon]